MIQVNSTIVVIPGCDKYPENLLSLDNRPSRLYLLGEILPIDRVAVAIVGTRSPTSLGRVIAYELAKDLGGAGVTIVSGLAAGIDAQAHRGAMDAGGRTIACLGAGTNILYPKSNEKLYRTIPLRGALVSEYPDGTLPLPWRFPQRNRIISGLSLGVVVVEAGEKSGAILTADWALKQGRPVMAVPGSPKSRVSVGTNRLIQDGAYLVTSATDVLSFLVREGECLPRFTGPDGQPCGQLSLEESLVLSEIKGNMLTGDEIAVVMQSFSPGKVMSLLSSLEVKGEVVRVSGGRYLVKPKEALQRKE